jgi:hypothetical protein
MHSLPSLLNAAGFTVRGNRFDCRCEGASKLTGSFSEEKGVAYCHRCHMVLTARSLAHRQGLPPPAARIRRTRIVRERFREWLKTTAAELSDRERRLARRAEWAKAALASFPDMEPAWSALAAWYHTQQTCELFWESVRDNVGRYWLYRSWRRFSC